MGFMGPLKLDLLFGCENLLWLEGVPGSKSMFAYCFYMLNLIGGS